MKHISKKSSLLLCGLGAVALLTLFTGSVNAIKIGNNTVEIPSNIQQHRSRLYSLYVSESAGLIVEDGRLNITKGFVIGNGSSNSSDATILGGTHNSIGNNSSNSGIAGGEQNTINGGNSVIGGGMENRISADLGVIAGGKKNTITKTNSSLSTPSVIAGGYNNTVNNGGTILGGADNTANGLDSLVFGQNAKGGQGSFAWNGEAEQFSAYIGAGNGVLIGTTEPKEGINLVVNGTMSIGGDTTSSAVAGEMRSVNGCFYAYDGQNWHIVGQYRNDCGEGLAVSNNCEFGNVLLQVGDKVDAYPQRVSSNCVSQKVVCGADGKLRGEGSNNTERYPYCYAAGQNSNEERGGIMAQIPNWSYGTITIGDITIMDRNLGATSNDINSTDSYGYYCQWGNNYGFPQSLTKENNPDNFSQTKATYINYSPLNPYYKPVFIYGVTNNIFDYWDMDAHYDNLWGGQNDSSSNNRGLDTISTTAVNRQGPCPDGWHVPSAGEWSKLLEYWVADYTSNQGGSISLQTYNNLKNFSSLTRSSVAREAFQKAFKIPFAGIRNHYRSDMFGQGEYAFVLSSSPYTAANANFVHFIFINEDEVRTHNYSGYRNSGGSVRCFKN